MAQMILEPSSAAHRIKMLNQRHPLVTSLDTALFQMGATKPYESEYVGEWARVHYETDAHVWGERYNALKSLRDEVLSEINTLQMQAGK